MSKQAFALCAAVAASMPMAAMGASVDLTSWTQAGPTSAGIWNVAADGNSVLQTRNGNPTYFVSPDNYFNQLIEGSFGVETTSDNDFVGFVFGWQDGATPSETEFLLFSWKQALQSGSDEGFVLAKVTGVDTPPFGNFDVDATNYDVLATNLDTAIGWKDNTKYGFSLDYTASNVTIKIKDLPTADGGDGGSVFGLAGTEIFNVNGSFETGKFGFYNHSQANVRYSQFTEEISPSVVPAPAAAGLGLIGGLGLVMRRRRSA